MTIEQLAKIVHEHNRQFCKAIGDDSQLLWEDAPDWQQESALSGVRFHIENPNASASHAHEEWVRYKVEDGWVYGVEKDAAKKTHPCFVPFENLPLEQQLKDVLFSQTVKALAPLIEK